ncbi:DUF2087 domain-containing protein [Azospirillum halopraeferens]|uniref:DUF2087 domain-containing protein n=1 Tax=Azospirillum halopraeferens TaxID=34010 RepID=UPI000A04961F|nr:DUF2087 domain-containing protein [Azospirillum halopraeferens]
MTRTSLPFCAADMSALARSLRTQLAGRSDPPGHVELLNMLSRAAGCRNFQHYRKEAAARAALDREPPPPPSPADPVRVLKVARCFDAAGVLARWPGKLGDRLPCLWVMWSRIPAGRVMDEAGVNRILNANHGFGDHALLRRELVDRGLLIRTRDGREYRRVERTPPPDALALIRHLKGAAAQRSPSSVTTLSAMRSVPRSTGLAT